MGRHNAGSAGCQDRAASSWRIGDGPLRGEGQSSNAMGRSVGIQRGGEAGRLYLRPALRAHQEINASSRRLVGFDRRYT